jgi:hypothetical protein
VLFDRRILNVGFANINARAKGIENKRLSVRCFRQRKHCRSTFNSRPTYRRPALPVSANSGLMHCNNEVRCGGQSRPALGCETRQSPRRTALR